MSCLDFVPKSHFEDKEFILRKSKNRSTGATYGPIHVGNNRWEGYPDQKIIDYTHKGYQFWGENVQLGS